MHGHQVGQSPIARGGKVEHGTPAPVCTPLRGGLAATPTCGSNEVRPRARCIHSGAQCILHKVYLGRVLYMCEPSMGAPYSMLTRGWMGGRAGANRLHTPSTYESHAVEHRGCGCIEEPRSGSRARACLVDGCRARAHPSHSLGPSRDSTVPSTVHHQSLNESTFSSKRWLDFPRGSCLYRGPRRNARGERERPTDGRQSA